MKLARLELYVSEDLCQGRILLRQPDQGIVDLHGWGHALVFEGLEEGGQIRLRVDKLKQVHVLVEISLMEKLKDRLDKARAANKLTSTVDTNVDVRQLGRRKVGQGSSNDACSGTVGMEKDLPLRSLGKRSTKHFQDSPRLRVGSCSDLREGQVKRSRKSLLQITTKGVNEFRCWLGKKPPATSGPSRRQPASLRLGQ